MPTTLTRAVINKTPIAGPAPYNTLVAVTTWGLIGPGGLVNVGQNYAQTATWPSGYHIAGFNPDLDVDFKHSTTVFLTTTPGAKPDNFIYALDKISNAGFDQDGQFYVTLDTVIQPPDTSLPTTPFLIYGWEVWAAFYISSFILVNEPAQAQQPPQPPAGPGRIKPVHSILPPQNIKKFQK